MRLRDNILANYAGQIYVTVVALLAVPIYLEVLGTEAYGLIGFFGMLQGWFALLDVGMTATISRETARMMGGATAPREYRQLYVTLSLIFVSVALFAGATMWLSAGVIAARWLKAEAIEASDVVLAVQVMAVAVATRWFSGLYRGVMTGAEKLVWLSVFNTLFATLRYFGVLLSMSLFGHSIEVFFLHQLAVSVLEVYALKRFADRMVPGGDVRAATSRIALHASLRPHLRFGLSVAFTSAVWVVVTQSDKLILSGLLSLAEYGLFSMATLLASGVTLLAIPITSALLPRLAKMQAEERTQEIVPLYRASTRWTSVIAGSAALTLMFFAQPILYAWTGNDQHAHKLSVTVALYAFGNVCLNFSSFVYCLQYAKGHVRLHVIGNTLFLVSLVPLMIVLTRACGIVGAGIAWAAINLSYLLGWVGYSHARLARNLNAKWLGFDIIIVLVPSVLAGMLLKQLSGLADTRLESLLYVCVSGALILIFSYGGSRASHWLELRASDGRWHRAQPGPS